MVDYYFKQWQLVLTETEKAYIAGLFDGEGCIQIGTQLRMTIGNVCLPMLEYLSNKCGGRITYNQNTAGNQKYYVWAIYSVTAQNLLKELLPYLIVKREEAVIAIKFQDVAIKKRREQFTLKIQKDRIQLLQEMRALKNSRLIINQIEGQK